MADEPNNQSDSGSRTIWIFGALVASILIGALVWIVFREGGAPAGPDDAPPSASELQTRKNRAIALLENHKYTQSAELFSELGESLPNDSLPVQNLAVARLLALEMAQEKKLTAAEEFKKSVVLAKDAIDQLSTDETPAETVAFLTAKYHEFADESDEAISAFQKAARESSENPALHYQLYLLANRSRRKTLAAEALQSAAKHDPENTAILIEQLRGRIQRGEDIVGFVGDREKRLLTMLISNAPPTTKTQGEQLLTKAMAAVEGADNRTASSMLFALTNILNPLVPVALDRNRLEPSLLEFVVDRFSTDIESQVPDDEPIPVTFTDGDLKLPSGIQPVTFEVGDFDLDGRPDIVCLEQNAIVVLTQTPKDNTFAELTRLPLPRQMTDLRLVDLDRDTDEYPVKELDGDDTASPAPPELAACLSADLDVVLYGPGGVMLLRHTYDSKAGSHELVAMPQSDEFEAIRDVNALEIAELDHDGDLDLIISTATGLRAFANAQGDGALGPSDFREITELSAFSPPDLSAVTLTAVDYDRSLTNDVLLTDSNSGSVQALENLFHGRFRSRELADLFGSLSNSVTLRVADVDGNTSWDLIGIGPNGIQLATTLTTEPGVVRLKQASSISETSFDGGITGDYDNDGSLDILAWNRQAIALYRGHADGTFSEVTTAIDASAGPIERCRFVDLDGDGDLDVLTLAAGQLLRHRNDGGNVNHWLNITLAADPSPQFQNDRNNFHGLGCIVEVKTAGRYQSRLVTGMTTHFGLGSAEKADVVRILWNNGIPQNIIAPETDQTICEKQVTKGSCPFLYAWDGERFEFITDCLWASPIGLQFAEGVLAPTRHQEFLKIPGNQLVEDDGHYRIMITEELWEACYLDTASLIAVDHPANVEIYSNEKVASQQGAEFHIHTANQPMVPVSVRDQNGTDLLPLIKSADGKYAKGFDKRITQGLTPDHYLEIDPGPLDDPTSIKLFLTGWMQPTDTSLNIALGQNPLRNGPSIPSIEVLDADGNWQTTIARAGFPGGKPKSIVLDLSEAFLTDDYRIRLRTSMEIYWDSIFFTVDEEPAELQQQTLMLADATLRYRGYSRWVGRKGTSPEKFRTDEITQSPRWPAMQGHFTRYGDVTQLLTEADDRMIVIGAGDAVEMRFKAIPPPPKGWTRDFILYNVGWDKDADLNTVLGQTVEPLPFRSMSQYPPGPDEPFPSTPAHTEWLERYQTRRQNPQRFWNVIRHGKEFDE